MNVLDSGMIAGMADMKFQSSRLEAVGFPDMGSLLADSQPKWGGRTSRDKNVPAAQ